MEIWNQGGWGGGSGANISTIEWRAIASTDGQIWSPRGDDVGRRVAQSDGELDWRRVMGFFGESLHNKGRDRIHPWWCAPTG